MNWAMSAKSRDWRDWRSISRGSVTVHGPVVVDLISVT